MRSITEKGLELIKAHEGYSAVRYICPAGIPTIGWGHTGAGVKLGTVNGWQADALLRSDVRKAEQSVLRLINVPLTDNQYAALVSFTFNLGGGALQRSTLRAKLNRGDYDGAANEFLKWVFAGGKKLRGLVKRREDERQLFLS
jgi:lysozyme